MRVQIRGMVTNLAPARSFAAEMGDGRAAFIVHRRAYEAGGGGIYHEQSVSQLCRGPPRAHHTDTPSQSYREASCVMVALRRLTVGLPTRPALL